MAHEINIRANGKAEMAYSGELPWHGLGQKVTPGASIGVWQKEAGLDWLAKESVVHFMPDHPVRNKFGEPNFLEMPSRKVIYRSDTLAPVGLVSDKYEIVQPAEVLEFFRDLTEAGDWEIETAGVLRGGSKIWAMAKSNIEGTIKKYDKVLGRLLLATSLDGSMKTTAKLCSERVVCANTLAVALGEAGQTMTTSHRTYFDADEVKQSLGVSIDAFKAFMLKTEKMADTPISVAESRELLRTLFGQPKLVDVNPEAADAGFQMLMAQFSKTPDQKLREQRSVDRALHLFGGDALGSSLPGSKGTQWGLLNAITQHIDHERGRSNDTRMDSAWFGDGEKIKTAAFDLLVEMAD